jgi:hypothetical protein
MGLSFGWAPHQVLLWEGLLKYNYKETKKWLRWLWLITKNAVEYNGTIPEKFDLEISSHSFLLNMEMWGQNLIISQRRFWLGKCILSNRFANNRSKHEKKAKSVSVSGRIIFLVNVCFYRLFSLTLETTKIYQYDCKSNIKQKGVRYFQ